MTLSRQSDGEAYRNWIRTTCANCAAVKIAEVKRENDERIGEGLQL